MARADMLTLIAMADPQEVIRAAYRAFNERDIDAALELMHPDVDWPNAWEGGRVNGRQGVRDYWTRQFEAIQAGSSRRPSARSQTAR